ncbi:ABC transporter permease (plasmid) [Planococcus glaciei]|uniref:ABC transporter permease n=1 Tax=Planococcus glaciei TaxID=459472 RepID=A0A7H8QH48_9BACL|nr:ABC transporter permease [Planococcus glaciei]QKX52871.1 ABC transporter permease [Planococcus glaciei]
MVLYNNLFLFYLKQVIKNPLYIGTLLFMVFMLLVRILIRVNEPFDYWNYGSLVGEMMIVIQAAMLLIIVYFYKLFSDEFRFGAAKLFPGFFKVTLLKISTLLTVHSFVLAFFVGSQILLVTTYFHLSDIPFSSFYNQTAIYIIVYWYLPLVLAFTIGILAALLFGKNKMALVFMILLWIAVGPMNTTFFSQLFQQYSFTDIESLFYIGPLSNETPFNDLIGYNVTLSAFFKVLFWIFSLLGLVVLVLMKTARAVREKGILLALVLLLVICNGLIFPYIFTDGKAAFNFADQESEILFYKNGPKKISFTQTQYEVKAYDIRLKTEGQIRIETELALANIQTGILGFVFYHNFDLEKIIDEQGKSLPFIQQGDFLMVQRASELPEEKLTFTYKLNDSTLLPVSEKYLFLPNSVSWLPTKANHAPFAFNQIIEEGVNISSVQGEEAVQYALTVEGDLPIYTNLPSSGKNFYSGEVVGGVTLLAGMLIEREIGGKTIVYPNSWPDPSKDWKAYEEVLTNVHAELNEMFGLKKPLPDQIIFLSFKRDAYTSYQSTNHLLYISGSHFSLSSQLNEIPSIYINAYLWNSIQGNLLDLEQVLVFNELLAGYLHGEIDINSPISYTVNGIPLYLGFEKNDKETQEIISQFYKEFYDLEKEEQRAFLVVWYKKMNQLTEGWPEAKQLLKEFEEGRI